MGQSPFDSVDGVELDGAMQQYVERPRLRLHHLLVLTAVMAVLLAINGPQGDYESANYKPPEFFRIVCLVLVTAQTLLSAAALTALGYGIAWYRRGMRFFDQPGHWLLLEISIGALVSLVPRIAFRSVGMISLMMINYGLFSVVLCRLVFDVYLGIKKCRERRWKSVFYTKGPALLLFGIGGVFVLLTTISALRVDQRTQTVRDQGHRCGVWLQLALSSLSVVSGALTTYNHFYRTY